MRNQIKDWLSKNTENCVCSGSKRIERVNCEPELYYMYDNDK